VDFTLTPTQRDLAERARAFSLAEIEPHAAAMDREGRIPDDLLFKLGTAGFLGLAVPPAFGGTGEGHLAAALVVEQLAASGAGAWWLAAFNNSIGATIADHGRADAVRPLVQELCAGRSWASIQFTEEATGSDPDALTTLASKSNDGYTLNGRKRFSTFGSRPGPAMVFAKDEAGGCTSFVVDKSWPGYVPGKVWESLGGGGVEAAEVEYRELTVPEDRLLGEPGRGFAVLLEWIAVEKVQQCAANVGIAQAALHEAVAFARRRSARSRPIADMQGIRWMLAEMQGNLEAARWLTYRTASLLDTRPPGWMDQAALAKVFVVPATIDVTETARRIHGAYGYIKDTAIERLCRAAAGATGVATSLEINRSIVGGAIARGGWR
jgi:alkylation response protein AidB-like acyl-CoA dehydrogenase